MHGQEESLAQLIFGASLLSSEVHDHVVHRKYGRACMLKILRESREAMRLSPVMQ